MFKHTTHIRVRYGETDKMGYVYYGNYALYYEQGRTEAIKSLGMSYKALEEQGYILPVSEMHIKYKRPAIYDDLLRIESTLTELPGRKMIFHTEVFNEAGDLLNQGETVLVFVNAHTRRACTAPPLLLQLLKAYF